MSCYRRGGARPVFTTKIPAADAPPSPPCRSGRGRGSAWPRSVEKRGRLLAARAAAILGDAGLRFDCLRESQLGDVIIHPDLTELSVFGSKTDHTLQGQPAVLPASNRTNSGTRALVEGTTEGLQRLLDPPLKTLLGAAVSYHQFIRLSRAVLST